MVLGQLRCNLARPTSLHCHLEDILYNDSCFFINEPMGRIIRIFHISVRNIGCKWNTTGTFGFIDGSDFATGITGIKLIDPVFDACHINFPAILSAGIEIIIDGNIADTVFRECDVGVQASHSRVSAKSGKVFCDTNRYIAGFNFIQHFLETRAVKR